MNRKIILFCAFLSTVILILVPSISCVNANIQNENNLNTKNINIDDIKTIKNRLLNSECDCQNSKETYYSNRTICNILYYVGGFILLFTIPFTNNQNDLAEALVSFLLKIIGIIGFIGIGLDCWSGEPDWW